MDDGVAAVERLTRYANEAVASADLKDVVASGHQRIERTIIDGNAANIMSADNNAMRSRQQNDQLILRLNQAVFELRH